VEYEKRALFPAAGLDPGTADAYYAVQALVDRLSYAGNEAARQYLNGAITREQAVDWLQRYAMMPKDRAAQRTRFFDQYRSYVINYNLGKDLVREWVERNPEQNATILVTFSIATDGSVRSTSTRGMDDSQTPGCVTRAVARARFPEAPAITTGETVVVVENGEIRVDSRKTGVTNPGQTVDLSTSVWSSLRIGNSESMHS
jgi:hypothetical protein